MYRGSRCTGKILKSGLYGGIGAAIGVLAIIVATVAFLLFKSKKKTNWDTYSSDDNDLWYEDIEQEWNADRGITNLGSQGDYIEDGSSGSSQSKKEKFRPRLENVDTTVEIKIQRPEVSIA
ncbi:mucin-17-like [Hyla sarda]|uniref:mucin-17-like n=1 Tax=Hyla sarda TaxID=327740 RepID=UPI0024C38435|nr:mucin-17-like [Hyla sarda]